MEDMKKLVRRAKAGNRDAFAKLYELTKDKAYFVAARYVSDEADTADILSDAYIAAMESISSFDAGKAFEPWLHTIVRNKAIDLLRKKKPVSVSDEMFAGIEDTDMLPAEYLESEEQRRVIISIIDKLPQAQRITVNLFYLDNLSVNEVSEIMSCSPSTVTSRLQYARKSIREAVLMEEKKTGDKLYGIAGAPFLAELLKREMAVSKMPSAMSAQVSSGISAGLAASVTVGGTVASTLGIGAKIMGLSVGVKTAVAVGAAIVLTAGIGIPVYLHNENEKVVAAMVVIQQQEIEEQARLDAETASIAATELKAKQDAEVSRIAAEKEEAARVEAARIEEERVRAEEEAKAAEEATRLEDERIAAEEAAIAAQQTQQANQGGQQAQSTPPNGQKEGNTNDLAPGTKLPGGITVVDRVGDAGDAYSGGSGNSNEVKIGDLKPGDKLPGGITIVDNEGFKPN